MRGEMACHGCDLMVDVDGLSHGQRAACPRCGHFLTRYREDGYSKYFAEWNAIYNNEPYLGTLQDEDFESICRQAGFPPETVTMSQAVSSLKLNVGDERAVRKFGVVAARN